MIEIERKFLVISDAFKQKAVEKDLIVQGFLNRDPNRTVRVRIADDFGYLTIKGRSNEAGTSRFEWEKEISVQDARDLLHLCEKGTIEKVRYKIPVGKHVFEVDEFFGENEGLVTAEVELTEESEHFEKPDWLGLEVTGDIKYYNSQLTKYPYKSW